MTGKDYFVGDIHGAFEKLQNSLEIMGFRPDRDRLISVGDLVDRGESSHLAETWLNMPYFHAVRGNHEDLYLRWRDLADDPEERHWYENDIYFPNGGRWVEIVSEDDHIHLERAIRALPYVITVPGRGGEIVAAVHAQLPDGASWPQMINEKMTPEMVEELTWSRNRMMMHRKDRRAKAVWDENSIPGLTAIVCGHYVTTVPTWVGDFYYIETAGWSAGRSFTITGLDQILRAKRAG